MAEFDANFTTFPDHPFIENTDNPNFVSSIFNKVKSITSAASNVVHNVLPYQTVITSSHQKTHLWPLPLHKLVDLGGYIRHTHI